MPSVAKAAEDEAPPEVQATAKASVPAQDECYEKEENQPRNCMQEAIDRGGLSGWFSLFTFGWAGPFLRLGASRTLKEDDLDGIYKYHRSRYLYENLRRNWERERARIGKDGEQNRCRRKGMMLIRAIWLTFRRHILLSAVVTVVESAAHVAQALALGRLVSYFDDEDSRSLDGWLSAAAIVFTGFLYGVLHHHLFFITWVLGMLLRISTTTILYDKILRLRLSSLGQITTGHLINLATTDVERLQVTGIFMHYIWEAPLETIVIMYFGINQVGVSFLSAFAALALLVPMQAAFSRKFTKVRLRMTSLTDERVKLTNQAVTGARLMKINAWEPALEKEIRRVRAEEVRVLMKAAFLKASNEAMFFVQPAVLSFLVFGTFYLLGKTLTPEKVFTTLALLSINQFSMGKFFYMAVQTMSESWVSIMRLEAILLMEENETLMEPLREFDLAVKAADRGGLLPEATAMSRTMLATTTTMSAMANAAELLNATNGSTPKANGGSLDENGLVSMRGMTFHWSSAGEDDEYAKAFRELANTHNKKKGGKAKIGAMKNNGNAKGATATLGNSSLDENRELQGNGNGKIDAGGFTLQDINLTIRPGQLVGIVGSVGSSKSSLLMAILREISPQTRQAGTTSKVGMDESSVAVHGRLAYAPQESWIQSGTVRENILFGKRMDRERYDSVVRDCALKRDLSILPSGDLTGIGDRGVNLSGGQKARVGLARMAYAQADTYLMDDPMSAVDPAVGRELFSSVVCGRLAGKTRILVTHQVHYLRDPAVDVIVVMANGKIIARGRYEELEANGSFSALEAPSSPTKEREVVDALPEVKLGGIAEELSSLSMRELLDGDNREEKVDQWPRRRSGADGYLDGNESEDDDYVAVLDKTFEGQRRKGGGERGGERVENAELVSGLAMERERSASSFLFEFPEEVTRSRVGSPAGSVVAGQQLEEEQKKGVPPELVVAEDKESGELRRGTYWEYIKEAAGVGQVITIFLAMAGGQVLIMAVTVWLAHWSRQNAEEQERSYYIIILAALVVSAVVVSLLRAILTFYSMVKASHRLHDRMLKRVICAPILFFDSNPVGRILNRFTKDIYFIDDMLPMTMYDFIMCAFMVLGSTIIAFVVNYWVLLSTGSIHIGSYTRHTFMKITPLHLFNAEVPIILPVLAPALAYFYHLLCFYMKTSREVKRLEATTRSPVFSQLSETLDGLVTIRAFGTQHRFLEQFTRRVDLNTRAYFAWIYTARWLGFRLDVIVIGVLIASCFFSVAVKEYNSSIDAGLLGAALVYVIQLGGLFQWTVRQAAETENQMVSVERVLGYCRVSQEARLDSDLADKPPDDWPSKGNIEIRNIFMRYREDLPPVLKGLNLSIVGGSRVGVVGRTGAGKSSLVSAMFRLVEYDKDRGSMEIDGVDISKVGLHDLRPRLSVVPQTPFLFSGSMRLNLDPFARKSDLEMWAALEAVQMKEYAQSLPGGLNAPVTEGGGNLSVGQRQLLCLARAVLQRSQILVMDEATANIDHNTDSLIQDVVRTSFKGRTVIMVAHRLNTVIDCDQVVVLSEGRVVEAGHPHLLLESSRTKKAVAERGTSGVVSARSDKTLASMVEETGPANAEYLRQLAREAWKVKQCREQQEKMGGDTGTQNGPEVGDDVPRESTKQVFPETNGVGEGCARVSKEAEEGYDEPVEGME